MENKKSLSSSGKIVLGAFLGIIIVLTIISSTLNLLKEEAEQSHINIANIYSKSFSEHFSNSIYNIELFVNNVKFLYIKNSDNQSIDNYLLKYLKENPYVRSISILEDKKIIQSTNNKNLDLNIDINNYTPKPLFKKEILRFGKTQFGRDFDVLKKMTLDDRSYLTFIPLAKSIKIDNKELVVLIALNVEHFINKYIQNLPKDISYVDILDLEGNVLISNDDFRYIGAKFLDASTLITLKDTNRFKGIKDFFNIKNIISIDYIKNYPLSLSVRFDYNKTLMNWEKKRFNFLMLITLLLVVIVILILVFIIKNNNAKQKEIELHKNQVESQKRFKILFEQNHLISFILDENGNINQLNNTALSFLGSDEENYLGLEIWDLYCFDEFDKLWLENVVTSFSEGNKIEREVSIKNSNLEKKEIDFILDSISIDGKKELVLFGKDITLKKLQEKELRQAYQVFKNTHDGIMITDEKVNIINVNNAFEKSTGYKLNEVFNQNPRILKSERYDENFYKDMWNELILKGFWDGEIVNRRKDGFLYSEWLTITAVYNEKNKLTNFIGIFSDITKQKNQEEIIKEKERMLFQQSKMASLGEMLGNIAHQWRQPLSVISVAAGAIKLNREYKDVYTYSQIDDFIDSITNSTKYLSETIDDFRNFFSQDTNYKEFDTLNAINKTLKLVSSNFKGKDIDIQFRREKSKNIFASENEFKQVIMNILNNSKDALLEKIKDEKKYIFIDVYFDDKYMFISILDNAGGIDESIIDKVFEPYFTTKHKSMGTGIGLYMSEEIITKHMHGEIIVSNETYTHDNIDFKGANFCIKIPFDINN
uniref:PAS domain S-box protein n=1 Tax=Aliarcobacter sp. TaxID=2321116 RepID=UPI004047DDC1